MKVWLIKRKGKSWWGNMEMAYSLNIGKEKMYAQLCFYRRKDAVLYLKSIDHSEYWEVISAEVEKSKYDNRLTKQT